MVPPRWLLSRHWGDFGLCREAREIVVGNEEPLPVTLEKPARRGPKRLLVVKPEQLFHEPKIEYAESARRLDQLERASGQIGPPKPIEERPFRTGHGERRDSARHLSGSEECLRRIREATRAERQGNGRWGAPETLDRYGDPCPTWPGWTIAYAVVWLSFLRRAETGIVCAIPSGESTLPFLQRGELSLPRPGVQVSRPPAPACPTEAPLEAPVRA